MVDRAYTIHFLKTRTLLGVDIDDLVDNYPWPYDSEMSPMAFGLPDLSHLVSVTRRSFYCLSL